MSLIQCQHLSSLSFIKGIIYNYLCLSLAVNQTWPCAAPAIFNSKSTSQTGLKLFLIQAVFPFSFPAPSLSYTQ